MRVVILHHSLDENAIARIASGLASHLVERGHGVSLAGITKTAEWHYDVDERVDTFELTRHERLASSLRVFAASLLRFRRLVRRARPDVIVSLGTLPNFVALAACIGLSTPLVINEQTDPRVVQDRRHPTVRNLVYMFSRPDGFVVLTKDTAALVSEWLNPSRVHVIPNPAHSAALPAARPRGGVGGPPFALAMGRLTHQKGFDMLLEAWAALVADHPAWRLVIAGEGPGRRQLEEQARRAGGDATVEFPGFTRDPFELMSRAELFVLSSRYEGFPLVLVEAMACALPVVAMDCPSGPVEIVTDGVDGFLVPTGDVRALASAMSRLMNDGSLRDEMGEKAHETAKSFAPERVWEMWEQVISRSRSGVDERPGTAR